MNRNSLSLRMRTSVGQNLPDNWETKMTCFREYCRDAFTGIAINQIGNMDEVPVSFDMPSNHTVDQRGADSVRILTTWHEKSNFTVVLSVMADGRKLPPMIIFKRKTLPRKEVFPDGVIIKANPKGWVNEDIMKEWIDEIWSKGRKPLFFGPSALILDSARAHITDNVKTRINTLSRLAVIPEGMTKVLQPLDLTVNRSFKSKLREKWRIWMMEDDHEFTRGGAMKRASYGQIVRWVKEAWDEVTIECVQNGFRKAGILAANSEPNQVNNAYLNQEFENSSSATIYDEGFE
ncbi:hypothetical protein ENBRE01_2830 [Enteropsectra breve]|nr:hypothetical protein ENBRE01_2830 [Enteropsectra breve]